MRLFGNCTLPGRVATADEADHVAPVALDDGRLRFLLEFRAHAPIEFERAVRGSGSEYSRRKPAPAAAPPRPIRRLASAPSFRTRAHRSRCRIRRAGCALRVSRARMRARTRTGHARRRDRQAPPRRRTHDSGRAIPVARPMSRHRPATGSWTAACWMSAAAKSRLRERACGWSARRSSATAVSRTNRSS